MAKKSTKLRFEKSTSIVCCDSRQSSDFSDEDLAVLFRFYVLESPVEGHSRLKKSSSDYGWTNIKMQNLLNQKMSEILDLADSAHFYFGSLDEIGLQYSNYSLGNGILSDITTERGVISGSKSESSRMKLFRHVRNCLCHGNYLLLGEGYDQVFIGEDHTTNKGTQHVSARFVIKKTALLKWATLIKAGPDA